MSVLLLVLLLPVLWLSSCDAVVRSVGVRVYVVVVVVSVGGVIRIAGVVAVGVVVVITHAVHTDTTYVSVDCGLVVICVVVVVAVVVMITIVCVIVVFGSCITDIVVVRVVGLYHWCHLPWLCRLCCRGCRYCIRRRLLCCCCF